MTKKLIVILSLWGLLLLPVNVANAKSKTSDKPITVFAASSLTDSFTSLGKRYEKLNPGTQVLFSFQASSLLATQIKQGAPADIFVSAEPFKGGKNYLINQVVVAVPIGSSIKQVTDLNNKIWIQCALEVPCGKVATAALKGEGVTTQPASLEPRASSVLAKLLANEVDAAIVYRTDVIANANKIRAIEFNNLRAASTVYQIAQLENDSQTRKLMNFLTSKSAFKLLESKGFKVK